MYFLAFLIGLSLGAGAVLDKTSVRESIKSAVFLLNVCFVVAFASRCNVSEWSDLVVVLSLAITAKYLVIKLCGYGS